MGQLGILTLKSGSDTLSGFAKGDQVVLEVVGEFQGDGTVSVDFVKVQDVRNFNEAAKRAYITLETAPYVG